MARIRTIKPEFWSSPGMKGLDPYVRLLFIAMWNWADDTGRGTANPRELAGFAFPWDEQLSSADIRRMLGEIRRAFGVVLYEVGGRPYYLIPSWDRHQKIDKRSGAKYPSPDDGTTWDPDPDPTSQAGPEQAKQSPSAKPAESSAKPAEATPKPRRTLGAGTGEQGNRGTGEVPPTAERAALAIVAPPDTTDRLIGEWIEHCRKRPPGNVIGQVGKQVKALLAENIDPADIRRGLAAWHSKGLHPSALPSVVNEVMNSGAHQAGQKPSTADQRFGDAMALAARFAAEEAS